MSNEPTTSNGIRILIAEDADDYARILMTTLTRAGYTVERVNNGDDAHQRLTVAPIPDLLITDVVMPGKSGFELLEMLKRENRKIPVIVLTSKQDEEDVMRGFDYGALDYIAKPFSPSVLAVRVKMALTRR